MQMTASNAADRRGSSVPSQAKASCAGEADTRSSSSDRSAGAEGEREVRARRSLGSRLDSYHSL